MSINTGNFPKSLWPGVESFYGLEYNEFATQYTDIYETRSSRKAFEEVVGSSGLGAAGVKPEGQSVLFDNAEQGFITRFTHVTYGLGFTITKEAVEDDLYDQIAMVRSKSLARSMRYTKELVAANVLNRATTAGYTGGDGKVLLATDHQHINSADYANKLSTAANLSEAALEDSCIALGKYTDDRGLRIATKPRKLIVPVDLQFEAERILHTDLRVATADNDLNAIKSLGKVPGGFSVNNYLTDTNQWFLLTDCPNGMIHFERRGDEFTMDNEHTTDNAQYKSTGRYSLGWADPKGIFGSEGAQSLGLRVAKTVNS